MEFGGTQAIDVIAIVLAVVALFVTVVGFFASLRFYREGMEASRLANEVMAKVGEKTETISDQVGGLFRKTLKAALGKRSHLDESLASLNQQISDTNARLVRLAEQSMRSEDDDRKREFIDLINKELEAVSERVKSTQKSVEGMTYSSRVLDYCNSDGQLRIIRYLDGVDEQWVRLSTLASHGNMPDNEAAEFLDSLVESDEVLRRSQGMGLEYRIRWHV